MNRFFYIFCFLLSFSCGVKSDVKESKTKDLKPLEILTEFDPNEIQIVDLKKSKDIFQMQLSTKYFDWSIIDNQPPANSIHINENDEIEVYNFIRGNIFKRFDTLENGEINKIFDSSLVINHNEINRYTRFYIAGEPHILITSEFNLKKSKSIKLILDEFHNKTKVLFLKKRNKKLISIKGKTNFIEWDELNYEEQFMINYFWDDLERMFSFKEMDRFINYVNFPLDGEWGSFIGKSPNGITLTKNDFEESIPVIFNNKVKNQLFSREPSTFAIIKDSNNVLGFQVGVSLQEPEDEFESSRIFKFILQNDTFKLKSIFHAG